MPNKKKPAHLKQENLKAVLINRSKRLMESIQDAVGDSGLDSAQIEKFNKASQSIVEKMEAAGFKREAKIHTSVFNMNMLDLSAELKPRVIRRTEFAYSRQTFFGDRQTDLKEKKPKEATIEPEAPKPPRSPRSGGSK